MQYRLGLGDKFIYWSIIMVKGGTLFTNVYLIILFAAKSWPSVQQRGLETTLLSSFQIATVNMYTISPRISYVLKRGLLIRHSCP